jgi:hypothetical protein
MSCSPWSSARRRCICRSAMNKRAALGFMVAAAATPALAQLGGRRRGGSGDRESRPADKGGGEPRVNALEVTVHELHEDLRLTAEQEPLWQAYVDKVRALGNDLARERAQRPAQANVQQQIDRIVDAARNRLTAMEDIAQAAKALYAKLAPEQQPAADPRLANLMAMPLTAAYRGS